MDLVQVWDSFICELRGGSNGWAHVLKSFEQVVSTVQTAAQTEWDALLLLASQVLLVCIG